MNRDEIKAITLKVTKFMTEEFPDANLNTRVNGLLMAIMGDLAYESPTGDVMRQRIEKLTANITVNRDHLVDLVAGHALAKRAYHAIVDLPDTATCQRSNLENEQGELGIGYVEARDAFELTLIDLNDRAIACMTLPAELFERAVAEKRDAEGHHPYVGVMFHLHTLKELIAS
jgi:hypothetical protein